MIKEDLVGSKIVKRSKYPNTGVIKLTLANGPEVYLKKTDFKKDQIRIRGYSSGGSSQASDDIYPSAKYTSGILSIADIGELTVSRKTKSYILITL